MSEKVESGLDFKPLAMDIGANAGNVFYMGRANTKVRSRFSTYLLVEWL